MRSPHTKGKSASPQPLWDLARLAAEYGWDVDIAPRGSSLRLKMRRGDRELVVRWKAEDGYVQGDGTAGWHCGHTAAGFADVVATVKLLGRPFFIEERTNA